MTIIEHYHAKPTSSRISFHAIQPAGSMSPISQSHAPDSRHAWLRLAAALTLGTIGSIGMWSVPVALPAVQADFGVLRAAASMPFTMTMFGFGIGSVMLGRLADRFGIALPLAGGALSITIGYAAAGVAQNLWQFALVHLLVGFGASASFGPLVADTSHWFVRRRGIAVAVASCGNYLAGVIMPPILEHFIATDGWRAAHFGVAIFCAVTMLPLILCLRGRPPAHFDADAGAAALAARGSIGISSNAITALLFIAGIACCVAMAMPQVHIVAYCGDLGYGPARGAEMLSLMLGFGIFNRIASGVIADRIGGLRTMLISSVLQGVALFLYLWFDGLVSLYVISALFGLFQGGIVPMYAVIVRELFPPRESGMRLGIVLIGTMLGMAFGGWMSGLIFDLTGSYRWAFLNGLGWNLVNVAVVTWLMARPGRRLAPA
jgi:MFS family permease